MSVHTTEYLHDNIVVGGVKGLETDDKGNDIGWRTAAWWRNIAMEAERIANGQRPSHYAGSIPIGMIRRDLFGWTALDGVMKCTVELFIPGDHPASKTPGKDETVQVQFTVPEYKGVIRSDKLIECYLEDRMEFASETVMNVASATFATDSLAEVLIDNTANIMDESPGDLVVTGAGVLKWGKVGYLEVSVPETFHNKLTGIDYRPNLLGSTSFDGSVATRWDRTVTNVVCDNTHQYALSQSGEKTGSFKVRRTKNFSEMLKGAREALGLIDQTKTEFDTAIEEWAKQPVSEKNFIDWMDIIVPIPELKEKLVTVKSIQGEVQIPKVSTNALTIAMNKRDQLEDLWNNDPRVSPWKGTKLGIVQLGNTWNHHFAVTKGAKSFDGNKLQARVEGNMLKVMDGTFAKADVKFIDAIDKVLVASA
jgi:phage/plasmid-like protein (TIGR03299 family)